MGYNSVADIRGLSSFV